MNDSTGLRSGESSTRNTRVGNLEIDTRRGSNSEVSAVGGSEDAAAVAAAEKSRKIREMMQQQRETNIISALRLIRLVSKPEPAPIPTEKKKKKKNKKNASITEKQLTLLQNIGNEEQLVLHNITDIYKEASSSFHHKTKKSPVLVTICVYYKCST
jgi:hypothetical protein